MTLTEIERAQASLQLQLASLCDRNVAVGIRLDDAHNPISLIAHLRLRDLAKIKSLPESSRGVPVVVKIEDYIDFSDREQVALLCRLSDQ